MKYRFRLFLGIVLSLFVSIFNGLSLTSMVPIFDSMSGNKNYKFQLTITKKDQSSLEKEASNQVLSRFDEASIEFVKLKLRLNAYLHKLNPDEVVLLFVCIAFPIYFLKLICLTGMTFFINSTGYNAIRDIREEIYSKVQHFPLDYFVSEKTGIIMSRIINDVDILAKVISSDLKDAINDIFYVVTHMMLLFFLSWKLFLIVFIVIPLIMGPISAFTDKIRKATRSQQDRLSSLNGLLQEVIAGIRVIRAFSMEKREAGRFYQINDELSKKTFKGHFYHQVGPSIVELFASITAAIFLAFGAYLISTENFSRGTFMAFFFTLLFVIRPIKQLSLMFNYIQSSVSAGERVFQLIDSEIEIESKPDAIVLNKLKSNIEFKNVSYKYPNTEKFALKNLNFTVQKGETVAFVGFSGAGKSTLKDLLPRLIDVTDGSVCIDGKDIRDLELGSLRRKISIVSQEVFLFNGSIRDNIAYGNLLATDEQVLQACEDACAMEFIQGMKDGIETYIGEQGVMLSGGQRQRISIARALLANPEILILDEATSALDTESERSLQNTLETIYKTRTTLIIAHRLSTIQIASRIFYMEDGEVIEQGTHTELISLNGKYKTLFEMQFDLTK